MDVKKVGRRFYQTYTKEGGGQFKGLLGRPSLTAKYSGYTIAGLILFTSPEANVETGDLFFSSFSRAMLCMDNADEESLGRTQKCFTVKPMSHHISWKRPTTTTNTLTGLEQSSGFTDLGLIYCSLEENGQTTSTLNIPFAKYKVVTNKALQVNDVLNGNLIVTKVNNFLGVTIADVRES